MFKGCLRQVKTKAGRVLICLGSAGFNPLQRPNCSARKCRAPKLGRGPKAKRHRFVVWMLFDCLLKSAASAPRFPMPKLSKNSFDVFNAVAILDLCPRNS
jgi:hypothetical protein